MNNLTPENPKRQFRDAFGLFATGVCVVGFVAQDGSRVGVTVNSFTSLSLDPALLLVCVNTSLRSHGAIVSTGGFGVSILSEGQREISSRFADRGGPKWEGMTLVEGKNGALMVPDAVAWFDCESEAGYPGGDHTILVGRVRNFMADQDKRPLLFFRGTYGQVT